MEYRLFSSLGQIQKLDVLCIAYTGVNGLSEEVSFKDKSKGFLWTLTFSIPGEYL